MNRLVWVLVASWTASSLIAAPPAGRRAAVAKLTQEAGGGAIAELEESSGTVRRLRWLATPAGKGGPQALARSFLERHREAFGVLSGNRSLQEHHTKDSVTGHHVRFRQTIGGLPVHGAWVAVDLDRLGRIRGVTNDSLPQLELATGTRSVSASAALTIALAHLSVRGVLRSKTGAETVAYPASKTARPAWRLTIPAGTPLGDWEVLVDSIDGRVLESRNRLRFVDGVGRVFDPNAVVAARSTALFDNGDSAAAVPDTAYSVVPLLGLDGSGALRGQFASVFSQTAAGGSSGTLAPTNVPSLQFLFNRSDRRFEEVMVYHHVDASQRFIQNELGFSNVMNRQLSVNAHAFGDDNSYYSPDTKSLSFGDGGVDDAEDGDVIRHEYGHAIQDDQIPGFGAGSQARALGEGFGDIFAVLSTSAAGQTFNVPVVADWDATAYSGQNPPALRRVDGSKIYPRDIQNEEHRDGEIWSGALWDCRNRIGGAGGGDRTMLRLLLQSHFSLTPAATFQDNANAVLAADAELNGGTNIATLRTVFSQRGILAASTAPVISSASPRSFLNRAPTDILVLGFGFTGATAVSMTAGSQTVTLAPLQVIDDGHIVAQVPAGLSAGSYILNVSVGQSTGSGPGRFHVDDRPDSAAEVTLADRMAPNGSASGNIGDGRDSDWYAFPVQFGASYTLRTVAPNDLDTVLTIFGPDGTTELATNDDISTSEHNSRISGFLPASSGTYFARVTGYDGRVTGPYSVQVSGPGGTDLLLNAFSGPAALTAGQPVPLVVDVRNVGDQASGPFTVEVRMTAAAGGASFVLQSLVVGTLSAGGGTTLSFSTDSLPRLLFPGAYTLSASADVTGGVAELDEGNNRRSLASLTLAPPTATAGFTLDLKAGLNLVALERQPFTSSGGPYKASDLARELGASLVVRVTGSPGGDGQLELHDPAGGSADFALEGNQGYLVGLPSDRFRTLDGVAWPAGTELVGLRRGINILAYPFGVPVGEGPLQLLERTGGKFVTESVDLALPGSRFKTVIPGSAAKPGDGLRAGRGYVVLVTRPPASAVRLPVP
ncbi:MAG: M36 family metallopeptidase [Candidatus Wallbacteria bacterium]|nr:M36 family metallopeptidase [Candidatus Wallbacteria bacterium]